MILLQVKNIIKSYAGKILLDDVSLEVKATDRIAIVGRNGTGKSTLLKIFTRQEQFDSGDIFIKSDLQIGYLAQHNDIRSTKSIWDEMMTVFHELIDEEIALQQLAKHIESQSTRDQYDEKLMNEYSQRHERFEKRGGYRYESE